MTPTSRRIFAYWLLLLLPTVGVGVASIYLLRREQSRLEERTSYADEARRAAVTARARLIAENVELLVGDVQIGLLEQLGNASVETVDRVLDQMEQTNPLVRAVFHCDSSGRVVRPDAAAGEEGRAFLRRFGSLLGGSPPWKQEASPTVESQLADAPAVSLQFKDAPPAAAARQEVASNVAKVQQARKDTRDIASKNSAPSYASSSLTERSLARSRKPSVAEAKREQSYSSETAVTGASTEPSAPVLGAILADNSPPLAKEAEADKKKSGLLSLGGVVMGKPAEVLTPERHGWMPLLLDGRLSLLGWVQPAGQSDVRGVEVEMAALISRLSGAMPEEFASGEGYALRDHQGRVIEQAGNVPREWAGGGAGNPEDRLDVPPIRIPLAAALLPGWEVIAFSPTTSGANPLGGGFLVVGTLLVGIFLVAIVTGGWLLLRQARQSEAEAVQKTSFVANVSHEFKTPLTTIRLYAELLEQGRVKNPEQGGDYLRTIGRETERLARLVGNALDFSRLEQGRKKYDKTPLDLGATVERMVATQQPRATEAGVSLRVERPTEPLAVTTDRDALEQILLNLIDNAAKYGAAGGEVTVQAATLPAGGTVVRVLDRGPGVPRAHWEKIFDKFHRVDDTLTAEKTGTGLGLSIARQLARGLGGELSYEPRDGGGAAFILTLP